MQDSTEIIMEETMQYSDTLTTIAGNVNAMKCDSGWFQMCADQFGTAFYFIIGFYLLIMAFTLICHWIIFEKAGRKGWESLIPLYNLYVFFKIIGRPLSNLLWLLLPFAGMIVLLVKVMGSFSRSFGKGAGFAWGLALFPLIFDAIMAFDKSIVYAGPNGANLPKVEEED